nr:hypothetical protein [Hoylesella enoeca]
METKRKWIDKWLTLAKMGILLPVCLFYGCTQIEDGGMISISEGKTNKDAAKFIQTINNQPEQLAAYHRLLAGKKPLYNSVKLSYSTEYGMVYFIPFQDPSSQVISGAIYYPVEYEMREDDSVILKDALHSPKLVDADILNNEIPITQRFLYSHEFAHLAKNGLKTEKHLLDYEFLKDSAIAVDINNAPMTRTYPFECIDLELFFMADYFGHSSGIIYGVSTETIMEWARDIIRSMNREPNTCRFYVTGIRRASILIPLENDLGSYNSILGFVETFIRNLKMKAFNRDFHLTVQYTFSIAQLSNYSEHGGYIVIPGGHSGATGSVETDNSNDKDPSGKTAYDEFEKDCNSIQESEDLKTEIDSFMKILDSAKELKGTNYRYIEFSEFTDSVHRNNSIEYAVAVGLYDYGEKRISKIQTMHLPNKGTVSTQPSTIFTVHNHGNQTPPSPLDLKEVCEMATDTTRRNFKGYLIYADKDSTFYGLTITDREKAAKLFDSIKDEIAPNNNFKEKGKCENYLESNESLYEGFSYNDVMIARLALVIKHFGGGIGITKYKKKAKNNITTYGIGKNDKPVKCE